MKFAILALAAVLLAGCATHSKSTLATVRAAGVSERTVGKLEHDGILAPSDLIELNRRGVTNAIPLKHIDHVGVDYVVQRDDIRKLRSAGVATVVTDALIDASERFVRDRYAPRSYYSDYYGNPWHYGGPWWWPRISLGYVWGGHHWGPRHHRHHRH